ncbi:MAG: response regulator, partial [bacterium]|nr:response regulator [bacterium]
MGKLKIVIAAEEKSLCQDLQACLRRNSFEVIPVREMSGIPGVIQRKKPDLVILDSSDGLKRTEQIRRQHKNIPIILITRQSSEARVLAALRAGVNDYFTLPLSHDTFAASVRRLLLNTSELTQETSPAAGRPHTQPMIGRSPVMDQIKTYL